MPAVLAVGAGRFFLPFTSPWSLVKGGGRVVRWCWGNFQSRGVLLTWIKVGQGPPALAEGAVVWTFFLSSIISIFFLPLSGRRPDID